MDMPGMDMPGMSNSTSGTDMNDMEGNMGGMGSMSMTMYFNFMMPFTAVFKEWVIADQGTLIGSCFGVVGLAVLYEIMKAARLVYERTVLDYLKKLNEINMEQSSSSENTFKPKKIPQFWLHHFLQSLLQIVQVFLAYLLMLIVMTYNVWLVLSACVGAGIGYFVAGGMLLSPAVSTANEKTPVHFSKRGKVNTWDETSFSNGSDCAKSPPSYENKTMASNDY